jgi:hypothetical protein
LQYIANLLKVCLGPQTQFNHGFDTSPGTAAPKMNKDFVPMAHVSSNRAWAQDGYLKYPHPTIIDGDMRWDSEVGYGWFWGWGTSDT